MNKESILKEVKAILNAESNSVSEEIVAYTTKGESLTSDEYIKSINEVIENVKNGEKTYSSEEVLDYVLNKAKR